MAAGAVNDAYPLWIHHMSLSTVCERLLRQKELGIKDT